MKKIYMLVLVLIFLFSSVYAAFMMNKVVAEEVGGSENMAFTGGTSDVSDDSNIITDPSKSIRVDKAHTTFKIVLQSNASTGYRWSLKEYDNNLIELKSSKYISGRRCRADGICAHGVPGIEKWVFNALFDKVQSPQITKITLVYSQPWNKGGVDSEKTFDIELVPDSVD